MARNRKRRSDRRPSGPAGDGLSRPGLATAGNSGRDDETPEPTAHASADVDLAEAQLALGRAELDAGIELPAEEDLGETYEDEMTASEADGSIARFRGEDLRERDEGSYPERAGAAPGGSEVARHPVRRLREFLRGSWRELQRVQWPDRPQVMQATGVVIGFVIVAAVFLGVADLIAQKLVNLILK